MLTIYFYYTINEFWLKVHDDHAHLESKFLDSMVESSEHCVNDNLACMFESNSYTYTFQNWLVQTQP